LHRSDICLFVEVIIQWVRRSSFLLGRCALGLLCSHAPTERVPGLNACPCRVWGWGGIGRENSRGDITQRPITPAPADPQQRYSYMVVGVCYRARHDSVWCMSVSIRWGSGPNNRLNLGCHQRRGAAAVACKGGETNQSTVTKGKHTSHMLSLHAGRGKPAQSGQRAARMSNPRRFHKVSSPSGVRRPS
jgi:hypothetical protein